MKWFRLYSEIKDDPKMLALSDLQFRVWIHLLALASDARERGTIPPYPRRGLAAALRCSETDLEEALTVFAELEMVTVQKDGSIEVVHFLDRQYDAPSDLPDATRERKARSRDNLRAVPRGHEDVTRVSRASHDTYVDPDPDPDPDPEREIRPAVAGQPPLPLANSGSEKNVGNEKKSGESGESGAEAAKAKPPPSPKALAAERKRLLREEEFCRIAQIYPAEWIEQVQRRLARRNQPVDNLALLEKILSDWKALNVEQPWLTDRGPPPRANGRQPNSQAPAPAPEEEEEEEVGRGANRNRAGAHPATNSEYGRRTVVVRNE